MIIKIRSCTLPDYREAYRISLNEEKEMEFIDGEPEDNTLARNFCDIYNIVDFFKLVYAAGQNGDCLVFDNQDVSDVEFFDA